MSETALELAERALATAPPGARVQATVSQERSLLLRFARSHPTQATAIDDTGVEVTAFADGHVGAATTNRTGPDVLRACARAAVRSVEEAARAGGTGDANHPGPPAPAPVRTHDGYDADTTRLDPGTGSAALQAAFAVAERTAVEAHGVWTAAEVTTAIASSTGLRVVDRVTDALVKVTALARGGRSGYAVETAVAADTLDPGGVAERAAAKATAAGTPARLGPGEYPVVFEIPAVGELLAWLGLTGFSGLAYAEGRSALCERLGTRVAAAAVNLSDSPRFPGTLPRSFDFEGVPKMPLPLIQDGVAHRVVHDSRSGAMLGVPSTGHALAPGGGPYGPLPTNLVLVGGGAADAAELCAPVERGVYVTRLWYTNAVRPRESLITGVTRDGTFLIEGGRVTCPLEDLRLTDSVLGIFDRIQALGARPLLTSDGEFYGRRFASGAVCPPMRVGAVRFTA